MHIDASLSYYARVLLHWRYWDLRNTFIEACSWVQSSGVAGPSNINTMWCRASANLIYYTFLMGSQVTLSFSSSGFLGSHLDNEPQRRYWCWTTRSRHSTVSCTFAAPDNQLTAYILVTVFGRRSGLSNMNDHLLVDVGLFPTVQVTMAQSQSPLTLWVMDLTYI